MGRTDAHRKPQAVAIDRDVSEALSKWCDENAKVKTEVLNALVRFFLGAGEDVRALLLGHIPKSLVPVVVKAMLKQMASDGFEPKIITLPPSVPEFSGGAPEQPPSRTSSGGASKKGQK